MCGRPGTVHMNPPGHPEGDYRRALPSGAPMSRTRPLDPRRLDVAAFALAGARLEGEWPLADLLRLQQDALPLAGDSPALAVAWAAQGEQHAIAGGDAQIRLHLQARTALRLSCQRCLQPMVVTLEIRPSLRFVHGEEQAERLDEDSEEDVLALGAPLDLRELIEDELILALPLVPRHDRCPRPLPMSPGDADEAAADDRPAHPFAALAALRRPGGQGGGTVD
jgi:uncharacterized protein